MTDNCDDLADDVASLRADLKGVIQQHQQALGRISDLEAENERLRDRVADLEAEVSEKDRLDDILAGIQQNSANDPETRAAVIVQTMLNDAKSREAAGGTPVAKFDAADCKTALGGDARRQDVYYAMKEVIPRETGGVAQYVQTPAGADQNNHVELDLRRGGVEGTTIAGHKMRYGAEVAND